MKQGNSRRSRSRGGGKRHGGGRGHSFESSGPDVKIRGTAQQLHEKYLALARDASSAGDRIAAESFFQYADHYHRILSADGGNGAGQQQHRGGPVQRNDGRPAQPPQPGSPQPVIAPAAVAVQASPDGKDADAAKTPGGAAKGPEPTAS